MYALIPCMLCRRQYSTTFSWYVCDKCGYLVCPGCIQSHKGPYGGGTKCSQCAWGYLKRTN